MTNWRNTETGIAASLGIATETQKAQQAEQTSTATPTNPEFVNYSGVVIGDY